MTLNAGDRLQNYEIRSTLGRGGFGMVYLAHDLNLDIDVALKVIHAELSANENILHRLRTGFGRPVGVRDLVDFLRVNLALI